MRENTFRDIYGADEIYRPPLEAESILLKVTNGCSYSKCLFCDYTKDVFSVSALEDIERQLDMLAETERGKQRLFMMGCNPLCLPPQHLSKVMRTVYEKLPQVCDISMYARAEDVLKKGREMMMLLRDAGVSSLHIGIESGCDEVLEMHRKGETVWDLESALRLLDECGIGYHLTIIPGLGGKRLSSAHASATAELLSRFTPLSVWGIALKVWDGTPLKDMTDSGRFSPMNYREILLEERSMIRRLEMRSPCLYVDSTALGKYTLMANLPYMKDWLLEQIEKILAEDDAV